MYVGPGKITSEGGRCRISWDVRLEGAGHSFPRLGGQEATLWIDWPAEYYAPDALNGDPALAMLLPVAMRLGETLTLADRVSSELLTNVLEVMEVYAFYFPGEVMLVDIAAQTYTPTSAATGRKGSFYSGGVDSLYNIVESERLNRKYSTLPVTDLWIVRGMDIDIDDEALWEKVHTRLQYISKIKPDLRIVDIHTNIRKLHGNIVGWEKMGFGPILGGISKCFAEIVGCALIGSYGKHAEIIPHSSSPLVDPLWSCERQIVRHFSCRVDRQEKIETIGAESPDLLGELRVCWKNPHGTYNCGVCEKCLRTQLQLKLAGLLDKCTSFEEPLTVDNVRSIWLPVERKNAYTWKFWSEIARACRVQGLDQYASNIERKVRRSKLISVLPLGNSLRPVAKGVAKRLKINY